MKRLFIAIMLFLAASAPIQLSAKPAGINFFKGSWYELLQKAKDDGKYIFVELYGNHCLYCKNMDTLVFTSPDVYPLYNQRFVSYKINYSQDEMDISYYEMASSYSIDLSATYLPLLLYFNSDGDLLRKESGGKSITDFARIAEEVINRPPGMGILASLNTPINELPPPAIYTDSQKPVQPQNEYNPYFAPNNSGRQDNLMSSNKNQIVIAVPTQPQAVNTPQTQFQRNEIPEVKNNSSITLIPQSLERDYQRLDELSKYFTPHDTTQNPITIREYAYLLKKLQKTFNAVVNYYLELEKDRLQLDRNREFIYDFAVNLENKAIDYFVSDIQYYKTSRGGDQVNERTKNAIEYTVLTAIREKDHNLFKKAETVIEKSFLPNREAFLFEMRSLFYQGIQDWKGYAKMVSQYMDNQTISDPKVLNDVAEQFQRNVNDKRMLKKATTWIQESIRIENEYYNNFTYALLLVRLKDIESAKIAASNAIYIADLRKNGTDTSAARQLLDRYGGR